MRITAICKHFNCLPYSGGIMEQPGAAMMRIERVIEAQQEYDDFQEMKRERGVKRH